MSLFNDGATEQSDKPELSSPKAYYEMYFNTSKEQVVESGLLNDPPTTNELPPYEPPRAKR